MDDMDRAHQGRIAIRTFQIIAHALLLRGYYSMAGQSGQTLEAALRALSPEIYGTMNDPKRIELKGLEYIMDRLPRGIEQCNHFVMTVEGDLDGTSFEKLRPPKRRRISYRVSDNEMGFVISTGMSEIYDILTHLTFLYIEAKHIHSKTRDEDGKAIREWLRFERDVKREEDLKDEELEQALWNLSILLGRTYHETRDTYDYFDKAKDELKSNNGLFQIIYSLCNLIEKEIQENDRLVVYFRPSLIDQIVHQLYGKKWATAIKNKLTALGLQDRPLHIISANLHSVINLIYGYAAVKDKKDKKPAKDLYTFVQHISDYEEKIRTFAGKHGFYEMVDESGAQTNCQIIDTAKLKSVSLHPAIKFEADEVVKQGPVLLVMDYAFGYQAFELMDELLQPWDTNGSTKTLNVKSISIMGKAGILPGKKGDIMLATAHVLEGQAHNYIVDNDLGREDFDGDIDIYVGPIVTVLGTSLQNRDILDKFQTTSWKAVGLEMEGGHYQRAINAAIIRGHIPKEVKVRYAYYASDNPLKSGQTLAAGPMGLEGIRPTYMITKAIIQKLLGKNP
ncbi:MAG: hypothetical protein LJE89_16995 [Deltaproteobacteria bacterium]|nr:hypothetical protein [Deltaproteobacteria bacterium]